MDHSNKLARVKNPPSEFVFKDPSDEFAFSWVWDLNLFATPTEKSTSYFDIIKGTSYTFKLNIWSPVADE